MSSVAIQPFSGTYRAQPVPSSFAFAVRHTGVFWFRGSLSDVAATLRGDGDALALEGAARVDSISVVEPAAMRASTCSGRSSSTPSAIPRSRSARRRFASPTTGGQRSTASSRSGASRARSRAGGRYSPPRPTSYGEVAGLQLKTSFDRRDFGFDWQMELPGGGDAVGWDVEVDIDLLLIREDADA